MEKIADISTHTPLTGRDVALRGGSPRPEKFLLTRPLRDVTLATLDIISEMEISTHTPLTGRDVRQCHHGRLTKISTHTPLTGRDIVI